MRRPGGYVRVDAEKSMLASVSVKNEGGLSVSMSVFLPGA